MTSAGSISSPSGASRPLTTPTGSTAGSPRRRQVAEQPVLPVGPLLAGLLDGVDVLAEPDDAHDVARDAAGQRHHDVVTPLVEREVPGKGDQRRVGLRRDDAQRHARQTTGRPGPGGFEVDRSWTAGGHRVVGVLSAQVRRLRQPQPMQPSSLSRSRSSRSIWASIRGRQPAESRAQSALVGVRPSGSVASASLISSRVRPTRWADRMNATRRRVARR